MLVILLFLFVTFDLNDALFDFNLRVHNECFKQPLPSHHELVCGEVLIFVFALVSSAEGCLHCEDVGDVQFFEHRNSGSAVLRATGGEARLLEREVVTKLRHYVRENSSGMRLLFYVVAVHEDVLSA